MDPPYSLTGAFLRSFRISGTGFGNSRIDVDEVLVGGKPCGAIEWLSSNTLMCNDVDASSWASTSVAVTVGS